MLKLPPGVEYEIDPMDVRYRRSNRGFCRRIKRIYTGIVERLGDDGLELIRDISTEYGLEIARRVKDREEGWDVKKIGLLIIKVFDNMLAEGEVLEFSDERVVIAIPKCPYPMDRVDMCSAHITMEKVLVNHLNPSVEFELEKTIPGGDSVCLYVIRKKTG